MISKPTTELLDYFKFYIDQVSEDELIEAFNSNLEETIKFFQTISEEKGNFVYEENKWSIKEVLCHIIDVERIFAYRALRFSRKDATELTGFDDELLVKNSNTINRSLKELIEDFTFVRTSTIHLFQSMNEEMLNFEGKANKNVITPKIIGWIIVGHTIHHSKIVKERYLLRI
jgi:hypothetical protein